MRRKVPILDTSYASCILTVMLFVEIPSAQVRKKTYLPKSGAGCPGFPSWHACSRELSSLMNNCVPPACETGGSDPDATPDSKNGYWPWCWTLTEPLELALGTGRGWHALPPAGSAFGERSAA
jgi:hypothetical protein